MAATDIRSAEGCHNCKFGHFPNPLQPAAMMCRKVHPVPMVIAMLNPITGQQETQLQGFFSPTSQQNWCGEYERKPAVQL